MRDSFADNGNPARISVWETIIAWVICFRPVHSGGAERALQSRVDFERLIFQCGGPGQLSFMARVLMGRTCQRHCAVQSSAGERTSLTFHRLLPTSAP